MGRSFLRPFLQNICCNSPWNYAVFWKLNNQHELVLEWEDGFCNVQKPKISAVRKYEDFNFEEWNETLLNSFSSSMQSGSPRNYPIGLAVAEMSSASHVIGKGLVGEVVLTRKARWIFAGLIHAGVFDNGLFFEYPEEWLLQFAAGIKTILLLPLVPYGVLQLGSVEMVAEDTALLSRIEDVLNCGVKPTLPDWRYYISELFLRFSSVDDSGEPAAFIAENMEGETALNHENELMDEYMFHDFHNKSEKLSAAYGISHAVPMDGDYRTYVADHNLPNFTHHDEVDWKFHGGWLEDSKLQDGTIGEANWLASYDNPVCGTGSNFLRFPEEGEPQNELGTMVKDELNVSELPHLSTEDKVASFNNDDPASECVGFATEIKPLLKGAVCSSLDDTSSCITSLNTCDAKNLTTKQRNQSLPVLKRDTWNFSASEFAAHAINSISCLSPSASSVESKSKKLSVQEQRAHQSSNGGKVSRLSRTNKRKDCNADSQRPRPRDRQLIQDRIKELRELVPNSEKCSIDGLLDKTIKHMLFLRSVTNQADKLKKHETNEKVARSSEINNASWAFDLGNDQQKCPIVVKDLDQPGHMLIEMLCADHDRFLEIADMIHRLQLTVLKGVMDNSLARFIVETSGSFHRLDIFWPLMQLLQQNRAPVITSV